MFRIHTCFAAISLFVLLAASAALAQEKPRVVIPHHQDKPPGPALSPQEAVKKMTVPEGFSVEIVAAEPDIVNPVAMTFDERGRIWITESLEYPRKKPGPGRDRVKILEDTDNDGRVDKTTVFAEGLNIPSGIAVGHGGVWVANSPDILFMQDTNGDGKADKQEVVVTGFGRTDTHELPNSFTWGPDGWLYGLNGVFNHSHVKYAKENPNYKKAGGEKQPGWKITCAMFRIHPRTREFEVFAEGTSNPWGIAFNEDGEAFVSACVIDHLWHITQTGYYHRQGGPYPPHTWKIGSIVSHKHQKAAYCGLEWFDSDAYPEKYRGVLYMGNIHGGCINVDRLHRDGSTYKATPEPDFLTAHDAWFMPVDQKTGPDGCLYILDWYDRYHCYQDANRDPAGIDRLKGRIYRVRYKNTPRAEKFDLAKETDKQLMLRLGHPNIFFRATAQRTLTERLEKLEEPRFGAGRLSDKLLAMATPKIPDNELLPKEKKNDVLHPFIASKAQIHALWTVIGARKLRERDAWFSLYLPGSAFGKQRYDALDPWVMRAIANQGTLVLPELGDSLMGTKAIERQSLAMKLQVAIAATRIKPRRNELPVDFSIDPLNVLARVLASSGDDKLIPHIVWNNLKPLLDKRAEDFLALAKKQNLAASQGFQRMLPVLTEKLLSRGGDPVPVIALFDLLADGETKHPEQARELVVKIAERIQTGQLKGEQLAAYKRNFEPKLEEILQAGEKHPLYLDAAFLAVTWKNKSAVGAVSKIFYSTEKQKNPHPVDLRMRALAALIAANYEYLEHDVDEALRNRKESEAFHAALLTSLGRLKSRFIGVSVAGNYEQFSPSNQAKAVELLTQRADWAKELMEAVSIEVIPANAVNANQARRMLATGDAELKELIKQHWGTVRTDRDPQRELYVQQMRYFIRRNPGDAHRGMAIYKKVCGQCHKLHGEGTEVGPDITSNGRNSFEQLLSNVFDPSLVIGKAYQARTVATQDGRILTGLLVEDSKTRVVLKVQGGKLETIARDDILESGESKLSMMPEDLEKQLKPSEIADLFAYLTLDKPPAQEDASRLPHVYTVPGQETQNPNEFNTLFSEVGPGFEVLGSGEGGVALLPVHRGKKIVVRTHPVAPGRSAVLRRKLAVPAVGKTRLLLSVSHHERGDWRLIVRAGGKTLHDSVIGEKTTDNGWADIAVDLSQFAGKEITLELLNQPTGWFYEHAYWAQAIVETTGGGSVQKE